jgi:hypothetical protein
MLEDVEFLVIVGVVRHVVVPEAYSPNITAKSLKGLFDVVFWAILFDTEVYAHPE